MPTALTAKWPKPKSEDEWEDMVLDAMRVRWGDPNAYRNGRRGQQQNGVDIVGTSVGGNVGAQAKNKERLTEADALREIAEADCFRPALMEYYFVVGGPRNAVFQRFLRIISINRMAHGLFPVHVIFFDDIVHEISSHKELVMKYWGNFFRDSITALNAGLDGPILDPCAALNKIKGLEQFKIMTAYFEGHCDPEFQSKIVVEHQPNLSAPAGDIDRFWRMAIGESYADRDVYLHRFAIAVEGKEIRIWRCQDNSWLTLDEWTKL